MSQISPSIPAPLDISSKIRTFSAEITKIKRKINYILQDTFINSRERQNSREIKEAFELVGSSLTELEEYIKEQEKLKEEILLFKAKALEQIIKIISSIVKFQEIIDKLYPNGSKRIVDYIGYLLIALVAVYVPILTIPASVTVNSVKPCLDTKNLTNILEGWKDVLQGFYVKLENKNNKETDFNKKYDIAEQIAALSSKTKISAVTLAELELNIDHLTQLNKKPEGEILKELSTLLERLPYNKGLVTEILESWEKKIFDISLNCLERGKATQDNIINQLSNAKENFFNSLNSANPTEKRFEFLVDGLINLFNVHRGCHTEIKPSPKMREIIKRLSEEVEVAKKRIQEMSADERKTLIFEMMERKITERLLKPYPRLKIAKTVASNAYKLLRNNNKAPSACLGKI